MKLDFRLNLKYSNESDKAKLFETFVSKIITIVLLISTTFFTHISETENQSIKKESFDMFRSANRIHIEMIHDQNR